MKRIYVSLMFALVFAIGAMAQTPVPTPPATTPGNVSRVVYYDVLPGKTDDFTTFLRMHTKPILDEQKKQGLILSYGFFTKPVSDGPGDWDVGLIITYATYADAIDFNADRNVKTDAISLAHYGSAEARKKANDQANELRVVVSSQLVRAVTLNPMPK